MKELLLLTLFSLLLLASRGDPFNALKFGSAVNDYIVYQPEMQPFETGFTVCSWIRKLGSAHNGPTWFSYAVSGVPREIQITDMGARTYIFGDGSGLQSLYTVTPGTWFHNCVGWDATSQTRTVYINGALVDSKATPAGRTLKLGGSLLLGNEQQTGPGTGMDDTNTFNGEIFKLNMFGKKLSDAEIKEMARDMCSEVEETQGEVRVIKWEDVLLKTRTGNVTEIKSECISPLEKMQEKLQQTEEKLNDTLADLENKEQQLNETIRELDQTKEEKETFRADLENKTQQLNATETQKQMKIDQLDTVTEELETTTKELDTVTEELNTTTKELETTTQELNTTTKELETTTQELDTVTEELNSTTRVLNETQVQLEQVKGLLGESANATMGCLLNTTITNHWDMLESDVFFEAVITGKKLEVLRKSMQNLGNFPSI